jgi:hypothetical protein
MVEPFPQRHLDHDRHPRTHVHDRAARHRCHRWPAGLGISYSTYRRYPHHVTAPRPARTLFWLVAGTIILLALGLTGQHQETYMRTFLIFALLLSLASPALARGHGGSHSHTSHHTHSSKR